MKKIIGIFIMTLLIATLITPFALSLEIINPSNELPPIIDQEQALTTDINWLEGGADNWQEFIPTKALISHVAVHIGCYYGGSHPVTLTIEAGLGLTPMTIATLDCSSMPQNQQGWVIFDVIDKNLNPGQKYYIVLRFDPGSEYGWSGSSSNPYLNGESNVGSMWDYAFRTYTLPNSPPSAPTINGQLSGKAGVPYTYTFFSTDSEGDDISYYIDWGDGTNTGWLGMTPEGQPYPFDYTWPEQGEYTIKAKAKDINGAESGWGTLDVTMPKNKAIDISMFLQRFSQFFPLFERILNQIK